MPFGAAFSRRATSAVSLDEYVIATGVSHIVPTAPIHTALAVLFVWVYSGDLGNFAFSFFRSFTNCVCSLIFSLAFLCTLIAVLSACNDIYQQYTATLAGLIRPLCTCHCLSLPRIQKTHLQVHSFSKWLSMHEYSK